MMDDPKAQLTAALASLDAAMEAAWREGWEAGYSAGHADGRSDFAYCDIEADWRKSATFWIIRIANSEGQPA